MATLLVNGKSARLHRLALLFGALAVLGGLAWWVYGRLEAQGHWRAALAALEAQDVERARRHLSRCVRYWPGDSEVRFWAARAARQAGAYEEAEEHLTECERLTQASSSPDVYFERLLLRAQLGDAQELRRNAGNLDGPQSARFQLALEALARGYAATMFDTEAARLVNLLLERSPDDVQGLLLRARLLSEDGKYEQALASYAEARAQIPDALEPRLGMGKTLLVLGRLGEAVQLYETLRQEQPGHPEVLYRLAQCRADLSQPDEAARLLDQLLAGNPHHVEGLLERGRLEFHRGRREEAAAFLRRALLTQPRHPEVLDTLAMCLEAQGQTREAEECRSQREAEEVEYGRVARMMIRTQQEAGKPQALRAVADELLRLGKGEQAVAWYFAALQESRQPADIHRVLAEYFERSSQPHRAARHRQLAASADETRREK